MHRSRVLFLALSAVLVIPILAGSLLRAAQRDESPKEDSFYRYLAVFSEVLGLVKQAYVDEPDMTALMSGALDGTTDALDPFSIYVPADGVATYQEARNVGWRHSGIALLKERGVAYVVAVEQGSPGGEAGVKVGDIVAQVDERSTRTMPLWEIQELLARPAGTKVKLELVRVGETVKAEFDLKAFDAPPARLERLEQGVTLLRIPNFDKDMVPQVRAALDQAARPAGANGVVAGSTAGRLLIDLRGVASGDAEVAYGVARLFVDGELGVLADRNATLQSYTGGDKPLWQGKTVVLVDRGTLGAAEVLATVLRQKGGAELVGERTFGHAGRQGSADLSNGGRLLFTDAFYTGPDKQPIDESLKPDLVVDERTRTFIEKDVPLGELILQRGVQRLLGTDGETAKKAA
ncbi:MAG TPA: S41 family peptidase [Thermoanaerobaculia bacterium]|nr:S41 family peptidase [Thermoanaerobaculia bacterium]